MNKTAQFTPGPWVVRHDDMVCSKEGRIIADCESTSYNMRPAPPIAEDKANAALIAAAPAMYEALQTLIEYLSTQVPADTLDDWKHVFAARRALAQAEGK